MAKLWVESCLKALNSQTAVKNRSNRVSCKFLLYAEKWSYLGLGSLSGTMKPKVKKQGKKSSNLGMKRQPNRTKIALPIEHPGI